MSDEERKVRVGDTVIISWGDTDYCGVAQVRYVTPGGRFDADQWRFDAQGREYPRRGTFRFCARLATPEDLIIFEKREKGRRLANQLENVIWDLPCETLERIAALVWTEDVV